MSHVVFYSGGVGSWATADRVIAEHGRDDVVLLFTDTLVEDPDLYRFLDDTERDFGVPITRIADGRDIWQVFRDKRMLGNSRIAPCSHELKQKPARRWVDDNCDPDDTILYVGIDWTETHRVPAVERGWAPYRVEAPLAGPPYESKRMMLDRLAARGIDVPRLYRMGMPHNNCGGGCVRAGQGHFLRLLDALPDVYADWEAREQDMRDYLGRDDVAILRDRTGSETTPLTLRELRERGEGDQLDFGGCGCFIDGEGE